MKPSLLRKKILFVLVIFSLSFIHTFSQGYSFPADADNTVTVTEKKLYSCDSTTNALPGFTVINFGNATYEAVPEKRAGYVYSGTSSYRFKVTNRGTGDANLVADYIFNHGSTYRISARMKSDAPTQATMFVRRLDEPYNCFLIQTVDLSTSWKYVEIQGVVLNTVKTGKLSQLRFAVKELNQNIYIDDIHISEVIDNKYKPNSQNPIPDTFFGMHFNRLYPAHLKTAPTGHKIVRAWDTATTWLDLEQQQGVYDWNETRTKRLDVLVDSVHQNDPKTEILYTMGQTPLWASPVKDESDLPPLQKSHYGIGAANPPSDMNLWRNYVTQVGTHFKGRIHYWELWNEPDNAQFYRGTIEQMVEMARIAREVLLQIDPANKIVSPGVTRDGLQFMDSFFSKGGGQYVDIIGFHCYPGQNIESDDNRSIYYNTRQLAKNYGQDYKPLWNTEGCTDGDVALTVPEARGIHLRNLLFQRAQGMDNFDFYFYEGRKNIAQSGTAMATGNTTTGWITPTIEGEGYKTAVQWIQGAQVVESYFYSPFFLYVYKLRRGNSEFYIFYKTLDEKLVKIPPSWNVNTIQTLDGTIKELPALPLKQEITLGIEPVMVYNNQPSTTLTSYYKTPASIPGTIQAEDYDFGGEGVAYHDVDSANNGKCYRTDGVDIRLASQTAGGYTVCNYAAGEWQKYTVNVAKAGAYDFSAKIMTVYGGKSFSILIDDQKVIGPIAVPVTGTSWTGNWGTVTAKNVTLPVGKHVLKLISDTGAFDIDSMTFVNAVQQAQTITFTAIPAKTYGSAPFPLTATASSQLPVTYKSSNPSVAIVSGSTVTIVGAGSTVITATQTGNTSYTAAPNVSQTLTVTKAASTVPIRRVTHAPTIDGKLSEANWNPQTSVTKNVMGASNNTATFDLLWDSTYLYVGVKVVDLSLHN
ncbi:MAG: carbohydrate-binding protein, partial [Verrucomicrobiota bacterium]